MHSFLIVAFSGIDLDLLAQASCLDLILFRNLVALSADIGHYIEIRIADTWTDHIRQHEYVIRNVQVMENRIRELIKDCPQPIISHYIGKSP